MQVTAVTIGNFPYNFETKNIKRHFAPGSSGTNYPWDINLSICAMSISR
ncbi:hypothetical protein TRIP_C20578 [Candidatus Zixiibacteriota bacterium]|nr:hypothetical protein TRIP_C20578 [candidate division Zixibacteria bacterium]